jgi:hypothetical protein
VAKPPHQQPWTPKSPTNLPKPVEEENRYVHAKGGPPDPTPLNPDGRLDIILATGAVCARRHPPYTITILSLPGGIRLRGCVGQSDLLEIACLGTDENVPIGSEEEDFCIGII